MKTLFIMSKKDILLSFLLSIFIITLSICIVVFFKPFYYLDIHYLQIPKIIGLPYEVIKENYNILIDYQSIFYQGALNLPDFIMSNSGRIHFEEVKRIFEAIQIICFITGISSMLMIYQNIKKQEYRYLRTTAILCIAIPLIIALFVSIDFNKAFLLFHKIMFRNDFWLFDIRTDPVVMILPEAYFMHCFTLIIVIIISLSYLLYRLYKRQEKKILNS